MKNFYIKNILIFKIFIYYLCKMLINSDLINNCELFALMWCCSINSPSSYFSNDKLTVAKIEKN